MDSFFYAYVIFFGEGDFTVHCAGFFLFYVNLKCAYLCKMRLKNACPSVVLFIFIIVKPRLQQKTEHEYHTTRQNNIERIYSLAQKFFVTKKHIRMQKSSTF